MSLFEHYREKGMKGFILYPENNFVNSIALKTYPALGFRAKVVKRLFPSSMDVNVVGHTVIQVYFPQDIVKKLAKLTSSYSSAAQVPVKELNELVNHKCEIKMVCFKNEEMAKALAAQMRGALRG